MAEEIVRLREEIERKTSELESLKRLLTQKEEDLRLSKKSTATTLSRRLEAPRKKERLSNSEILRYSRQLILPEIGVKGQVKLCNASVLVVGAGGLGCPAALYLAAAGVGRIGIVDYDTVEVSNLHRQVLHTECRINISKAESVREQLNQFNSSIDCVPYCTQLTSHNALQIIEQYDIVLDATDNVATRYLLNDACVMAMKPLVSGSALRLEGQLTVYNCDQGPCYRCLFPKPPPPDSVGNCSDTGVLGPVPGVIGTLQAVEAIKIATGIQSSYCQKMLVYDALDGRFLTIKLRPKRTSCPVCGDKPSIDKLQDYEAFCGALATDKTPSLKLLEERQRISVQEYKHILDMSAPHVLLDVREPVELDICSLQHQLNIPLRSLNSREELRKLAEAVLKLAATNRVGLSINVFVLCKQGNDSQKAVKILREKFQDQLSATCSNNGQSPLYEKSLNVVIKDIAGGLYAWARHVDKDFPIY